MKDLKKLQEKIDVDFKDESLLEMAFIHRSYLNENSRAENHNERLEFLGDAVLELVVTEYLFNNYPNPEGELTNWRSALVKTETISKVAKRLGFEDYLLLSKGEKKSTGRSRRMILANCFEAVLGAIYQDQGYDSAKHFIHKELIPLLPKIIEEKLYIDPKSRLQELTQEKESITPEYKVIGEKGPDHDRLFTVGVYLNDRMIGKGEGHSKQIAQQEAAAHALKSYEG